MKKGTTSPARQAVKDKAIEMGEFTRDQLLTALESVMDRPYAAQAFDAMVKRDPEIRTIRREVRLLENKQRIWTRVYRYLPHSQAEDWPKTLHEVGAARAIAQRSQTAAKKAVAGYSPQHFTAPFRAPSESLPDGFPPRFDWDGRRGYAAPPAISLLQATLRRPMARDAA